MEMNFASRGVANAGLTTGIIGASLGALNSGIFNGGLFGNNAAVCSENMAVNRYELNQEREITKKDTEIAYLKGRDEAKTDMLEMYKYVDGRLRGIEAQLSQQAVLNTQISANLACMQQSINALSALTKTVIPITNVCPEPMARYNTWTAPTTEAPAAG